MMKKTTDGWIIDIRRDDGMGIGTWFDNEADAVAYEALIWERGYIEGESYPEDDDKKQFSHYPIAKCTTTRFRLSFEAYTQGRKGMDSTKSPQTTTYNWKGYEEYVDSKEANDEEN